MNDKTDKTVPLKAGTALSCKKKRMLVVTGVVTGFVSGFFGGGGGMIVVPMLTLITGLGEKEAHATAIAVMLPVTLAGAIVNVINGNFHLYSGLPVVAGVFIGGLLGAAILKKIKNKVLSEIFAVVMAIAGIKLLFF